MKSDKQNLWEKKYKKSSLSNPVITNTTRQEPYVLIVDCFLSFNEKKKQ